MRSSLFLVTSVTLLMSGVCLNAQERTPTTMPDDLRLKDYQPKVMHKIPVTTITKAKYPVIDMHSHPYLKTDEDVAKWVKYMDATGVEKVVILSGATGSRFDSTYAMFSKYKGRFEVWCGFDYSGCNEPGYGPAAVAELQRCVKVGATGVGEIIDKGRGFGARMQAPATAPTSAPAPAPAPKPTPATQSTAKTIPMHIDDPRMDPLLEKCAVLKIPVNVHVADPIWMYQPMDPTNDGLMNAYKWRLDNKTNLMGYDDLIGTLEHATKRHPKTTFIACHFANLDSDLGRAGELLDRCPNLYMDISGRMGETGVTPRFTAQFYKKYQDRLLYGTDNTPSEDMYRLTFRMLESLDDHFYAPLFEYHWSYYGLGLDDRVLRKLYRDNARDVLKR